MKFPPVSIFVSLLILVASSCWGAPLTLSECLQKARDNNPELRSAAWESRMAEQGVRQASSARYPRLDGQVGYTVQQDPQAAIISGRIVELQDSDYTSGGLTAGYTIYDFGRRQARIRQARAQAGAARNSLEAEKSDVALQVIGAYFGILEANRLVTTAGEEVTQVQEHRRVAQSLFDEGVVTRNDILQAEVRLAAARQNLLARRNHLDNVWLRLNYLTGNAPAFRGELNETDSMTGGTDNAPDPAAALTRRSELLALRQGVEAARAGLDESRAAFFPELFTRLALEYVDNSKYREQTIMSATVGLRMNLFDGFATSATRDLASQQHARAQDLLRQAEAQVRLEIDTADNDLRVATERIGVAEAAIRQSRENLRINRERYQERVGTATEVLDAQTLLTQTSTDFYRAQFDRQVAAARLKRALGEL